jgi:hypothetical protein
MSRFYWKLWQLGTTAAGCLTQVLEDFGGGDKTSRHPEALRSLPCRHLGMCCVSVATRPILGIKSIAEVIEKSVCMRSSPIVRELDALIRVRIRSTASTCGVFLAPIHTTLCRYLTSYHAVPNSGLNSCRIGIRSV